MTRFWLVFIWLLLLAAPLLPQEPSGQNDDSSAFDYEAHRLSRIVTATRLTGEITLDGRVDESAWLLAVPVGDFLQRLPFTTQPSRERTEVRVLYDDDNLYVGFISFDSDVPNMVVNELREDFDGDNTDGVSVILDSLHDGRSGYIFSTNPAGAKRDAQISDNGGLINNDWDGVWDVKASISDEGWSAEYVLPFKTLRFTESSTQEWGINFARRVWRLNEQSQWSLVPIRYPGARVGLAGTLRGLENIRQGRNLKVKPFVSAGVTQARPGNNPASDFVTDGKFDGGVDAKYSLTPSLTLDLTYRTDFAQAEADQQQVNLTRFNLFFPEKRDFFLENQGIFGFGPPPNIPGGGGPGSGNLVPFFSRRIGLSSAGIPIPIVGGARVSGSAGNYSLGFLTMKTDDEGSTPANVYTVGRVRRNFLSNSWVGGLVTNRDSTLAGDYNRVYGLDTHVEVSRLHFDSFILNSDTPGRTGPSKARKFQTAWRDDELTISADYNNIQPDFNPEVGFVRRGDLTQYAGEFYWNPLIRSGDLVRNFRLGGNLDYSEAASTGTLETRNPQLVLGVQFQNNASITFNLDNTFDRLTENSEILGIPIAAGDYRYRSYSLNTSTNRSKRISGNANVNWGEFWNGDRKSFSGGLTLKPNYHWNIDFNYSHNRVSLTEGNTTAKLLSTRLLYAFTPRAFLNAFVQYNAATHQVSSNIRFNLTHHPLSDLYLVYNDLRDTNSGELLQRAFVVKLTNLFNF